MTKRPPEVRNPKVTKSVELVVPKANRKCTYCEQLSTKIINGNPLCDMCFDSFCEVCNKVKPFITARRKTDSKHDQMCSDCYSIKCKSIVLADKNYDSSEISDRKKDIYD